MTTTNINFKNNDVECYSLGRNGYIKTKGIAYTHNGDIVTIEPIRANGQIGRCSIQIPFEDLLDFVKIIESDADNAEEMGEEIYDKDIAIGDTIEIDGKTYKCVKSCENEVCENCALFSISNGCDYVCCGERERADETDVHFELVNTEASVNSSTNDAVEQEERDDYTNPIIGHVYEINGTKCICKTEEDESCMDCDNCCFEDADWEDVCQHIKCSASSRSDNRSIYFEAIE